MLVIGLGTLVMDLLYVPMMGNFAAFHDYFSNFSSPRTYILFSNQGNLGECERACENLPEK